MSGQLKKYRECHVKGDLLLVYEIRAKNGDEAIVFVRAGTHSDLFR
ncbi:MAG: type II toxin-antitoxin system mRNA interferase toxin, RelE/StbE family [Synergistaceae bacterium]|nr:type II toxin-antitoxin system mRNA interferase toxin, RelE/StbE family [Synergistaceae bacterium]